MAPLTLRIEAKSHGGVPVLGRIALALREGETVALTGPSGCGKTTLLRIAAGLDRDFLGTCARQGRLAVVFQEPRLLPWRSVRDNVLLAQAEPDPGFADALLETLDLAACAGAFPPALSLGMARRVAIVRALATRPEVLLLDEPFASLDSAMARRVQALLRASGRVATLLVTHDAGDAEALAHRVVTLGGRPARIESERAVARAPLAGC
jgi:NitT/TauT family transport system ATP-binding protein